MTQAEFNLQPKNVQLELIDLLGFAIGQKNEKNNLLVFYCFEDFFIEIKYRNESLQAIHSFKNPKELPFYSNWTANKSYNY